MVRNSGSVLPLVLSFLMLILLSGAFSAAAASRLEDTLRGEPSAQIVWSEAQWKSNNLSAAACVTFAGGTTTEVQEQPRSDVIDCDFAPVGWYWDVIVPGYGRLSYEVGGLVPGVSFEAHLYKPTVPGSYRISIDASQNHITIRDLETVTVAFDGSLDSFQPAEAGMTVLEATRTGKIEGEAEGACCDIADGSCFIATQAVCDGHSTTTYWAGAGYGCEPENCRPVIQMGACCYPTMGCLVGWMETCERGEGMYLGDWSNCAPNRCASPVETTSWGQIKKLYR